MPQTKSPPLVTDLRRAIKGSGLTSYALGKQAAVAPIQIDRFVSGERGLSAATAGRIADALGLVLRQPGR